MQKLPNVAVLSNVVLAIFFNSFVPTPIPAYCYFGSYYVLEFWWCGHVSLLVLLWRHHSHLQFSFRQAQKVIAGRWRSRVWGTLSQAYRAFMLTTVTKLLCSSEPCTSYRRHTKKLDNSTSNSRTKYPTVPSQNNVTLLAFNLYCSKISFEGAVAPLVCPISYTKSCAPCPTFQCKTLCRWPAEEMWRPVTTRQVVNVKVCEADNTKWEASTADKSKRRVLCYNAVEQYEEQRHTASSNPWRL